MCDFQVSVYSREGGIGAQCLTLFPVDFIDVNILEGFYTPAPKFFFHVSLSNKKHNLSKQKNTIKILFNYIKN